MNKPLQAVIFDLDGVITDTAEYHYMAWKALAETIGISFSRQFNEQLKGISRMDSLEKILIYGGKEQRYSTEEKIALATKKNNHYVSFIQHISSSDMLPGISSFLTDIRAKGLKVGLASASKNADSVMASLGLKNLFHTIVDASKIKNSKPDPEVFLTAAKQLEVDASACIGIEDAEAGVVAINAAGMFSVAIGPKASFVHANLVYEDTSQLSLEDVIAKYNTAK